MERIKEHQTYLNELQKQLSGENLATLDFDILSEKIQTLSDDLAVLVSAGEESAILRADICARIAGMAKATAVAKNDSETLKQTLAMLNGLDKLPATELIKVYRRENARFRDCFAVSFGMLDDKSHNISHRQYDDFK